MSSDQITIVSLNQLVAEDHQYRKFKELFDFKAASIELEQLESKANFKGFEILRLFKCLLWDC